jgi:MFS family permease
MVAVIGLALFASGTPSPLYTTYRALFSLSPIRVTLVYATYAFGVLATLLLAGPVSDTVGRRPVLLVALGSLMVATVLFTVADSVVWLFLARGTQGLATGLALSAAGAALLDPHPRHDPDSVGLHNAVASATGMGLGVLVSAATVELLPALLVLAYLLTFVLFAVAFGLTLALDDPAVRSGRLRLRPQRPAIPAGVRPAFALAGLAAIVLAAALDSGAVYILANIVAGTGFGAAFLGALRTLARDPTNQAQLRDVGVLPRRPRLAVRAGDPRRRTRHAARTQLDVRDPRRPLCRRRGRGRRACLPQPPRAGDVADVLDRPRPPEGRHGSPRFDVIRTTIRSYKWLPV